MFRNTWQKWDQLFLNQWCCDVPEHITEMRSVVPEQMMLRCSGTHDKNEISCSWINGVVMFRNSGTHHRNEISCPWKNGVAMFRNTLEWDPLFLNKWCCDVPEHITKKRSVVPEQMMLWCSGTYHRNEISCPWTNDSVMFRIWSQNEINCSWTNDVAMFRNTLEWDQLFLNKWCCDVPEHFR